MSSGIEGKPNVNTATLRELGVRRKLALGNVNAPLVKGESRCTSFPFRIGAQEKARKWR